MSKYTVVPFDPVYLPAFVELNREWIETYFRLEKMDLTQLENPHSLILEPGGEIFFVRDGDTVVGTCAMIPHGPHEYELAKMAVDPKARGQGLGDLLMTTAIEWARKKQAHAIMLLSNTKLKPAIALYLKHGFETVGTGQHPDYDRCNIEMRLTL